MGDAAIWRFVVFVLIIAALVYLQFHLAHRQWSRLKGGEASEIDVGYIRIENYLAQSFRTKVRDWLLLPASADHPQNGRIIVKGKEKIRVTGALELAAGELSDDILVVEGDFSCGPGCTLARELCIRGNAKVGAESNIQALAADGELVLGERVTVARWLDSGGELTLGNQCEVGARITSLKRIRLGTEVRVPSVYAPEVATAGWDGKFPGDEPPSPPVLEIVFPEGSAGADPSLAAAGLDPKSFSQLSSDCWVYQGDLRPPVPVNITKKLVVKGDCYLPGSSVVDVDIKVSKSLSLGPSSVCKGNLIAGRNIYVARGCRLNGLIHAGQSLFLSSGTRGFRPRGIVAAYAHDTLSVESDVAVQGKLAAGGCVTVVDAGGAASWRSENRLQEDGAPVVQARKS